jgi:hypothetical protein
VPFETVRSPPHFKVVNSQSMKIISRKSELEFTPSPIAQRKQLRNEVIFGIPTYFPEEHNSNSSNSASKAMKGASFRGIEEWEKSKEDSC